MISSGSSVRNVVPFNEQNFQSSQSAVSCGTGPGDATSDYDDIKFVVVDSGHINVNVFTSLGFVSKHKGSKLFSLRKRRMAFFGRNFNIF